MVVQTQALRVLLTRTQAKLLAAAHQQIRPEQLRSLQTTVTSDLTLLIRRVDGIRKIIAQGHPEIYLGLEVVDTQRHLGYLLLGISELRVNLQDKLTPLQYRTEALIVELENKETDINQVD